ncbi:MAG: AAA family ATPase [Patescibacteria group bacterium]
MNLVLLYGPPAVGKLTIAKELASLIGYTIFDNHMVLNVLTNIFGFDHPSRKKLEKEFRLKIVDEAIKANINLIMTGVIVNQNLYFYTKVLQAVEASGGKCFIIQLIASESVLKDRVEHDSRKNYHKISNKQDWEEFYKEYPEMYKKFSIKEHLLIDTTDILPQETAKTIANHYKLRK